MASHRIGALLYLLWGLLHIYAAYGILALGRDLEEGLVQARLYQDAAFMGVIAVAVSAIALRGNWRNQVLAYWINLALVSVADIIFLALVVAPGYLSLARGLVGPILWLLAVAFTTHGYLRHPRTRGF